VLRASAVYVLLLAALLLGFDWVWDDRALIVGAELEPLPQALWRAWTSDFWALAPDGHDSGMYRPLVTTTYILERSLGLGAGFAHLVNLALHVGVALGAAHLADARGGRAAIAGALVLVHPHAAELLGNVAARTDLMAALFVVWSLVLRGRAALPLMLAACLSKEVAFMGVGVHLVWSAQERSGQAGWAVLGAALALGLRLAVLPAPQADVGEGGLLVGAASSGWALVDMAVPLEAGPWPVPRPDWVGWAALAVGLASLRWTRSWVAWALLFWFPMAGWLPLEVRPSRALLYLPAIGLALWLARFKAPAWPLFGLALLQVPRMMHWKAPLPLWTWATEQSPEVPLAWLNLGRAHAEAEDFQAAEVAYVQAASLAMQQQDATFFVPAATSLGRLALRRGDVAGARVFFQDAISVAPPGAAAEAEALLAELGPPAN